MRNGRVTPVRVLIAGCVVVGLLMVGDVGTALAATSSTAGNGSQRYIVVLKGDVPVAQVLQDAKTDGATPQRTYSHVLSGYSADLSLEARNRAEADPNVAMVVRDSALHLTSSPRGAHPNWGPGTVGNNHQPAGQPVVDYSQFIPTSLERVFLQDSRLARVKVRPTRVGHVVDAGIAVIDSRITPNPDLNIAAGSAAATTPPPT
jgi:hypothetical protein